MSLPLGGVSEAQLLYPKISNEEEVGCLLSNSRKKQILWNYAFELFDDEIHNMKKYITVISIRTLKLKFQSYYIKKEKLAR